ncbi:MAG: hypothetical protein IJU52_07960 [Clostridia bacterium]|nr:hypothetical protein [Clostridia bacterium]
MKKIAAILLTFLIAFAFAACAGTETPKTETPTAAVQTDETQTAETPTPDVQTDETPTPDVQTGETPTAEPALSCLVYVSIVDQNGELVCPQKDITVRDLDADGKLTIDEAFIAAHEAEYPNGKDGYASGESQYGLSIYTLWGSDEGRSFSYYLNGKMAGGLTDEVVRGDFLDAYVFADTTAFSDTYCYFDMRTALVGKGDAFTLKLTKQAGFDENWAPVFDKADAGVQIVIDGKTTEFVTDENGAVTISIADAGEHVVSATSAALEGVNLVPPVCLVTVE